MQTTDYMNSLSSDYIDSLHKDYLQNPLSVGVEWRRFFEGLELGLSAKESITGVSGASFIDTLRNTAHRFALLDPLGINNVSHDEIYKLLNSKEQSDLTKDNFYIKKGCKTNKDVLDFLVKTYCSHITVQFNDCSKAEKDFLVNEFEQKGSNPKLTDRQKLNYFNQLNSIEAMEKFLHSRFVGAKRFSIEGSDTGILLLEVLLEKCKAENFVIAMAHRGRINVLTNFMGKAINIVLSEFDGQNSILNGKNESGDVKYHMGFSTLRTTEHGPINISLAFNPSHLEYVCPVVSGSSWAKQRNNGKQNYMSVLPVMIHGDAAFAGQGVVYETLQMSGLVANNIGGTVHIVFDNQIGFTVNPHESKTALYSTDIAKVSNTPVIHVNADKVEHVIRAAQIAITYRNKFFKDIVIRHVGYRRHGHNEGDEPSYTQPSMYDKIKKHPTVRQMYADQLTKQKIATESEIENLYEQKINELQGILDNVRKTPLKLKPDVIRGSWTGLRRTCEDDDMFVRIDTSGLRADIDKVIKAIVQPPKNFNWHPKLKKQYEKIYEQYKTNGLMNWTLAEMAAYGSLILEGTSVRITGQDSVRGTFSHRHAKYFDHKNKSVYSPLDTLSSGETSFIIHNSFLSETAVLGFEYGVSAADPWMLTIWEAQFGDFANGAQVIIDQFIVAAESKWNRMSGVVLFLPHGYEGQGPEHSSARLERFLSLCTNNNMQVCNPTTPAQFFHLLRRQVKRDFRKPLVIMTPKSLLRHRKVVSHIDELCSDSITFNEVLEEKTDNKESITKILLCSGKIYYDLLEKKQEEEIDNVVIVRLEQVYPFPGLYINKILKQYPNIKDLCWVQEEPRNMGAYRFVRTQMYSILNRVKLDLKYIGRPLSASPATGCSKRHAKEQEKIINESLGNLSNQDQEISVIRNKQ